MAYFEVVSAQVDTYATVVLRSPEAAKAAKPGQFLHIKCEGFQLRRPISIGAVAEDTLTIYFEVKGGGTKWLSARKPGDVLDVLGPVGNGFPRVDGKILLVGGGIGVPPMFSCAQRYDHCDAVLAFRSEDRALLVEAFQNTCGAVKLMSDDGSLGQKGFAASGAAEMLAKNDYAAVFVCGPKIMLRTVAQAAENAGVPCYVSMEERMGCGIGACLGCSVPLKDENGRKMARVCADGPVFDAREVDWDG